MMNTSNKIKTSWSDSILKEILNIDIPLIQAPMAGGATTPELVAAVSNAGGLGSLAGAFLQPEQLKKAIHQIRQQTNHTFAVNLFIPNTYQISESQQDQMIKKLNQVCGPLKTNVAAIKNNIRPDFNEQMEIIINENVAVFSFTFGILDNTWLTKLKNNGAVIIGTATTLAEANALEAAGVDIIAAQSIEAGGHRGTFIGEVSDAMIGGFSLIPLLSDHCKVPVIAAGGIMDARGINAALALGASGVQMGTAFLTCTEAGIPDVYKEKLVASVDDNTTLTKAFSGKFARGLRNQFIKELSQLTDQFLDYPVQDALTRPIRKVAASQNNAEFMSLWAGQSTYLNKTHSVKEFIEEIKADMD